MPSSTSPETPIVPHEPLGRLFLRFLKFGALAWGGPAAQIAMIKRELVVPFRPKNFDKVPDALKDARGFHVAQRLNVVAIVVR